MSLYPIAVADRSADEEVAAATAALLVLAGAGTAAVALKRRRSAQERTPEVQASGSPRHPAGGSDSTPVNAPESGGRPSPGVLDLPAAPSAGGPEGGDETPVPVGVHEAQVGARCPQHAAAALLDGSGVRIEDGEYERLLSDARRSSLTDHSRHEGGEAAAFGEQIALYNAFIAEAVDDGRIPADAETARPLTGALISVGEPGRGSLTESGDDPIVELTSPGIQPPEARRTPVGPALDRMLFPSVRVFERHNAGGEGSPGVATARLKELFLENCDRFEILTDGARHGHVSVADQAAPMGHFVVLAHRGGEWRVIDSLAHPDQPRVLDRTGMGITQRGSAAAARALVGYLARREREGGEAATHIRIAAPLAR